MRLRRTVVTVLVAIMTVAVIAGCGATTPPDQAVSGFLDDYKALNISEAGQHLTNQGPFTEPLAEEKALMQALMGKVSYKVTNSNVNGSEATVDVEITSVDMVQIANDSLDEAVSAALSGASDTDLMTMVEQALIEGVKSDKAPVITTKISVPLKKSGREWKLALSDEEATALYDAITGNMSKAYEE